MPSDLPISPVAAPAPVALTRPQPQPAPSPLPEPASSAPIYPNPATHIDPATNLLVVAFRNSVGDVVDQMPTAQQLDAYREQAKPQG